MKGKVAEISKFIEKNGVIYGANKHLCISAYLKEVHDVDIPPHIIRMTQTLDRAWRKALEENQDLDYRGSTEDSERAVKRGLVYKV